MPGASVSVLTAAPSPAEHRVGGIFDELHPALTPPAALFEAHRCLQCGGPYATAPCTLACPAGIDVPAFIAAIGRGDLTKAAVTIFAENLLGGTCSRVCPVEALCQSRCVLEHEGRRPVEIGLLQRHATDWALAQGIKFRTVAKPKTARVAVIGAGPAGMVCAGELAILGYRVTVYDAREDFGGLVRYAIAPYRQQREPLPQEARLIAELGVDFHLGFAVDRIERLRSIEAEADAVFLGVGLGDDIDVRYRGKELPGVLKSLAFIEAVKLGRVDHVGHRVAVIGDGNTAIDVAREALRLGAEEVTMIYRRTEAEMPAYQHEVEEAREEGVQFEWLANPIQFLGSDHLQAIECQHMRLGEPDTSGRRRPEPVPGSEFVLPVDTAILAMGQKPRVEFFAWIDGLILDDGLLKIDPATGQTTNPKYFSGGDAVNGGATVVEAVRAAKIAARGIDGYLRHRV
ncbi:MAG: NAD(P)-dependent oxidoreductase [Gemmatimonadetes bacterium]|nr:NAD(P)-dependent oxidoreductase [Gemmatimonadota bacterium]